MAYPRCRTVLINTSFSRTTDYTVVLLHMTDFKIKVNENQYQENKYRVSVGHPETLSVKKVGVGHMGSAQEGILPEKCAKHVARGLRLEIEWSQYDELTDELCTEIESVTNSCINDWRMRAA